MSQQRDRERERERDCVTMPSALTADNGWPSRPPNEAVGGGGAMPVQGTAASRIGSGSGARKMPGGMSASMNWPGCSVGKSPRGANDVLL
jgi:hypothetical protein